MYMVALNLVVNKQLNSSLWQIIDSNVTFTDEIKSVNFSVRIGYLITLVIFEKITLF